MSDLLKSEDARRERADMDLQAYRALAREQAATIRRMVEEAQDLRAELHSLQGEAAEDLTPGNEAAADAAGVPLRSVVA